LADRVSAEIEKQLATLPTAETARAAIVRNSAIVLVRSDEEAVEISNNLAPEHLSIHDASLLPRSGTPAASLSDRAALKQQAITPAARITCSPLPVSRASAADFPLLIS
jgi:hypothetical protein